MRTASLLRFAQVVVVPVVAVMVTMGIVVGASASSARAEDRVVKTTVAGEPADVLRQALLIAEKGDFDAYLAIVSPDMKWTPTAIELLKRYPWKRFTGRVKDYFVPGSDHHFVITREEIDEQAGTARIFLDAPGNPKRDIPTPCRFKKIDGKWLVHENSL